MDKIIHLGLGVCGIIAVIFLTWQVYKDDEELNVKAYYYMIGLIDFILSVINVYYGIGE